MDMSSKHSRNPTAVSASPKAAVNTIVENSLRQLGASDVQLPQLSEIRDYLIHHPELADIVLHAARAARETIGGQAQLSLEMYLDPEVEDSYPTLCIRKDEYAEDIFNLIQEIRSTYEPDLAGKSGWFLVTTDLCPPCASGGTEVITTMPCRTSTCCSFRD